MLCRTEPFDGPAAGEMLKCSASARATGGVDLFLPLFPPFSPLSPEFFLSSFPLTLFFYSLRSDRFRCPHYTALFALVLVAFRRVNNPRQVFLSFLSNILVSFLNMSISLSVVPVPEISISLASPEEPVVEPFSPFALETPTLVEEDSYRPSLLSPPPIVSPKFARQLSPLRPADLPSSGKGLERERFDALLKACRDRNASGGAKKSPDLRKEVALKAYKTKQSMFSEELWNY